ncbi:MAG: HEAT repeat domain-containing protein [Polyangiaceae bacterium]|nr:HEAT repeat domain-containing protein [Polyangiaceae bacterium]
MTVAEKARCASCALEHGVGSSGACRRCGWDAKQISRRCVGCGESVVLAPDTQALRTTVTAVGVVALGASYFSGFFGTVALLSALVAIGRFVHSRSVAYRCRACNQELASMWVRPFEREAADAMRSSLKLQSLGFVLVSCISIGLFWFFVFAKTAPATEATIATSKAEGRVEPLTSIVVEHEELNFKAAQALGEMGAPGVTALEELLHRPQIKTKRAAVFGLAFAREDALVALPTLMAIVENETDGDLRGNAMRVMGEIGPKASAAIPLLERVVAENKSVSAFATNALRKIRPKH